MSTTYTMPYRKGRTSSISVTAQSDGIAKAAAELLQRSIIEKSRNLDLIEGLTKPAVQHAEKADKLVWRGADAQDLRRYHLAKSADYIKEAADLVAQSWR